MKKIIMLVLVVGIFALVTGCATTVRFGSENAYSLSGDIPKFGQLIDVIGVINLETSIPPEQLVVWKAVSTADQPKVLTVTGARIIRSEARGPHLARKDRETFLGFSKVE
jgi:hypothetical protein